MAHDHHHHGESLRDYFTEQLLTILVCGLFGFAAIQMYRTDKLGFLAEQFRAPVLYGGIGVLVLVALRAVAIWKEAGAMHAHTHDHDHDHDHGEESAADHVHGPDCDHDSGTGQARDHHTHDHSHEDHGHSHDMSWVFARMLILAFPVALFFLGVPNSTFSKDYQLKLAGNDSAIGAESLKELAKDAIAVKETTQPDGSVIRVLKTSSGLEIRSTTPADGGEPKLELIAGVGTPMRFNDLNDAAFDQAKRESLEGQTAILEGRFKRLADKEFTLFRLKMTCCAPDSVPLKVRIIVPQAMNGISDFDWVRVKGQIQFLKDSRQNRYIPVIMVADIADVRPGEAKNEYE